MRNAKQSITAPSIVGICFFSIAIVARVIMDHMTIITSSDPRHCSSCYISIYTCRKNSKRAHMQWTHWCQHLQEISPTTKIEYLSPNGLNFNLTHVRKIVDLNYTSFLTTLTGRLIWGLQAFLETNANWYLCTTDDAYVYPERLLALFREYTDRHDPLTESVFKGQVIECLEAPCHYIQGGAGWVFSRHAAQLMVDQWDTFISRASDGVPDDLLVVNALDILNLTIREAHEPRFLGIDVTSTALEWLTNEQYDKFDVCPPESSFSHFQIPTPVNKMVIWHGTKNVNLYPLKGGAEIIQNAPNNLHYTTQFLTSFCLQK